MAEISEKHLKCDLSQLAAMPDFRRQLDEHLRDITEGLAFRGSQRSAQFLHYIVEQALLQHYDLLKERMIGVELFGRAPSYDTGVDAVVRVTASDVRKRLLQHYGGSDEAATMRIRLPQGSYLPEIELLEAHLPAEAHNTPTEAETAAVLHPTPSTELPLASSGSTQPTQNLRRFGHRVLAASLAGNLLAILLLVGFGAWHRWLRPDAHAAYDAPWACFLHAADSTILVPSDPNIAELLILQNSTIAVSDYNKQYYIFAADQMNPGEEAFSRRFFRGDKAAVVDLPIAMQLARLLDHHHHTLQLRNPRSFQYSDLDSSRNFIFLGSPQSNPWTQLFNDQLDFRFGYDPARHAEFITNMRPRKGELSTYMAEPHSSYALIAMVQNPDHNGQVLLIAGLTGEATESAGRLITDLGSLSQAMEQCGIRNTSSPTHFELLLHLNWNPGYPNHISVIACHQLTTPPGHLTLN